MAREFSCQKTQRHGESSRINSCNKTNSLPAAVEDLNHCQAAKRKDQTKSSQPRSPRCPAPPSSAHSDIRPRDHQGWSNNFAQPRQTPPMSNTKSHELAHLLFQTTRLVFALFAYTPKALSLLLGYFSEGVSSHFRQYPCPGECHMCVGSMLVPRKWLELFLGGSKVAQSDFLWLGVAWRCFWNSLHTTIEHHDSRVSCFVIVCHTHHDLQTYDRCCCELESAIITPLLTASVCNGLSCIPNWFCYNDGRLPRLPRLQTRR